MDPLEPEVELWLDPFNPFARRSARSFPSQKVLSPAEGRREARERTSKIISDYFLLEAIMKRHEAKIQKRWKKKTTTQRLMILLEAWPGMPTTHRPDFAAFRKYSKLPHKEYSQHRDSFMWPYINQEDLVKSKTLPLLLNARGRNHPSVFAAADGDSMHLGYASGAILPRVLSGHFMMLNNVRREEDYGRLVCCDENEQACKKFRPGEGLDILEAQGRLLVFLICCCQRILQDIPSEVLASNSHPIQPEPPVETSNDPTGFTSLATMVEEAPYRIPAKLDLQKIKALLAAQASHAQDHIWALREDPGYFADALLEMKEHQPENLKDHQGNVPPMSKLQRKTLMWSRVIPNVVLGAIKNLEIFSKLHQQAHELQALQKKHQADKSPLRDPPEEYLRALLIFGHSLKKTAHAVYLQLIISITSSPPMRGFFIQGMSVLPNESSATNLIDVKPGANLKTLTGTIIILVHSLFDDGRPAFRGQWPIVVDELERLLKAEQKARDLVSPYVAMLMGEHSIITECARQLDTHQPWTGGVDNPLAGIVADIKCKLVERKTFTDQIEKAVYDEKFFEGSTFVNLWDKKFDYPTEKRRSKANVEKLRAAEAHLDTFWAKFDNMLYSRPGYRNGTVLGRLLSQQPLLQRTPEWNKRAAGKNEDPNKHTSSELNAATIPLSTLFPGPETSSARKEVWAAGALKQKVKSREKPSSPSVGSTIVSVRPVETQVDSQPTIPVDARALKVFRTLFFDVDVKTTPGEVAWNDFLHAMACAGFGAQKLYGSVWHFQPTKQDLERSIQLHEPHPSSKMPFFMARRYGRRLNRAYGWLGSTFVLADK